MNGERGILIVVEEEFRSVTRYFEVKADIANTLATRDDDQRATFFQSQKDDMAKAELDAAEDANRVQSFNDHRSTVVPWLRETGIVDHLQGLKKDEIKAATALSSPEKDSSYLPRIIESAESMLREAHSWCFDGDDCMLTWPCRVVLSRFQSSQTESFGKIPKRVLAYFDRVAAGEDYFFSAKSEEENLRPEDYVDPTQEQLEVWLVVCTLAKDEIPDGDKEKQDELKTRLIEFWMLLITQDTGSRRYSSPLLSFCVLLSIKPSTQGLVEPGNFNSNLSAIIWVVQLLIFYSSARKERDGQGKTLESVKYYCEKYLQQTVPTLLESEYRDCRRLLYDDLMFGIKDVQFMRAWELKDSANNDTFGWNFVQHRDN
ncbi:hypothetical protein KC318_g708 [Hortaea werneckii]|nr:hypothetical protein KC318_g708 [Hortaea werneckii]